MRVCWGKQLEFKVDMFLAVVPDRLESFECLSFIVFRLVIFFCLSAVLGQCYCVLMKKNDIHIPIHILYLFILDIFTKKKWRVLVLIKKKRY